MKKTTCHEAHKTNTVQYIRFHVQQIVMKTTANEWHRLYIYIYVVYISLLYVTLKSEGDARFGFEAPDTPDVSEL